MKLEIGGRVAEVSVSGNVVRLDGVEHTVEFDGTRLRIGHRVLPVRGSRKSFWLAGRCYAARELAAGRHTGAPTTFDGTVRATMPGTILAVKVEVGQTVEEGQPLLIMESMKMEMSVEAPADGTVQALECAAGDLVAVGALLIRMEVVSESPPAS